MFNVNISSNFEKLYDSLSGNKSEQQLILNFMFKVNKKGLFNYNNDDFPGKLAKSWSGVKPDNLNHIYAKENNLWHYHIGHTQYVKGDKDFMTSEWIVHFIWNRFDHLKNHEIKLVDYTPHKINGAFPHPQPHKF